MPCNKLENVSLDFVALKKVSRICFCGGHLGLQDDRKQQKFENVPIGFAYLKNVHLDTEIIIV